VTEFLGTFLLVSGILAIGYGNGVTGGMAPFIVGMLIAVIGMAVGGATGFAINPARDLGPRIAHAMLPIKGKGGSNWGYAWVPIVGPALGGIVGGVFYVWFISMAV
ncbi:MAG: aquaporin, partial [Fusobacterium sp.]